MNHYKAFDKTWFIKHQSKLLFWLRFGWFRRIMRIDRKEQIVGIMPNCVHFHVGGDTFVIEARTHDKYSKRLYYAFKPLWWAMHGLDWAILDRQQLIPSFGFDTLTVYPDADPESTSVDGVITSIGTDPDWSTAFSIANGGSSESPSDSGTTGKAVAILGAARGDYTCHITRSIFVFDISSLNSGATISDIAMSLYVNSVINDFGGTANIYSVSPSSATSLAGGDFSSFTFSSLSSDVAIDILTTSAYNSFSISSTPSSPYSLLEYGCAESSFDAQSSSPGDPGGGMESSFECYFADQTGTSNDPKVVITYTLSSVVWSKRMIIVN